MSRLVQKVGLAEGAGLFEGAGLYKYGTFDPLSLNPYLLFDAETSMLGTLEAETLDLDPANPSSLDVITATRSGVATRTLPNGTIATAQPNTVRVDYTQGEQLTPTVYQRTRFTDFSSGWLNSGVSTVANTESFQGQVAKRFTVTGNGIYYAYTPVETGQEYTASFYARLISGSPSYLYFFNNGSDLVYTPISVTSEWQRFTTTVTSTGTSINSGIINTTGTEPVVVEISQPQFEEGTTASGFVANTTGSPKFITGATFGPRVPMILVEPSATNLLSYSEDFGSWSKSDVSLSTGFASPDGLLNARNVTPDATSTTHLFASFGLSSDIKTYSIYAKANGYKYFRFNTGSSGNGFAEFDVEAGTVVGTGGTYYSSSSIDAVGGGWFRCSMTLSAGAANNITIAIEDNSRAVSYLADGVSSLLFWGAQVETGSVSTSYIPTSGGSSAARTRAADDLVISGSAFTDFFNGSEGTIYVEVIDKTPTENSVYVSGQSLNQGFLYSNVDLAIDSYDGANFQRISGVVANELFRAAATYDSTSKKISLNGTTYADGVHNGNWGTATILNIGWGGSGNAGYPQINGHIKRLIYWPTHSDNL